jgi:hypothetical protein
LMDIREKKYPQIQGVTPTLGARGHGAAARPCRPGAPPALGARPPASSLGPYQTRPPSRLLPRARPGRGALASPPARPGPTLHAAVLGPARPRSPPARLPARPRGGPALARGRARPWRVAVARQAPLPTARPRLARRSRARLCPTRSPRPIPCSVRLPAPVRSPARSRGLWLGAAWPWRGHGAHSRHGLGSARAAPTPGTASVVRAEPRRGPCSARCPRRARRTRGSRLWRSARCPWLPRLCAVRPRPGAASASAVVVPLRSTARVQLGPGV